MASPPSTSSHSPPAPPPSLPRPHLFTAEGEEEAAGALRRQQGDRCLEAAALPAAAKKPPSQKKILQTKDAERVISSNKCRPTAREKISVVPLDTANGGGHGRSRSTSTLESPGHNNVHKSLFSSLAWWSPRLSSCSFADAAPSHAVSFRENEWRAVATELSRKLIHATRKRDEALSEASRLNYSTSELAKKLVRLETYCRDLKSALDRCNRSHRPDPSPAADPVGDGDFPLELFLSAVSDARSAVRHLSRSLLAQMGQAGNPPKAHDRISQLLQPYDVSVSSAAGRNDLIHSSSGLLSMEALLSRAFYEDFESSVFQRGSSDRILEPGARAENNLASYTALRGLSWEGVLSRGTRHYCEGFSRFCDRKMGQVAGMWWVRGGAWPEPLLQAFFRAAKGLWLVHLLAWCGHPPATIFRVDKGVPFDARFMEDVAGERVRRMAAPSSVRMMVAPGFYAQGGVVKCKVLCMHQRSRNSSGCSTSNQINSNNDLRDERSNTFRGQQKD